MITSYPGSRKGQGVDRLSGQDTGTKKSSFGGTVANEGSYVGS